MLTGACRTTFRPILTSSIDCHIRSRDQALGSREVLSRSSGRYAFNLFAYQLAQLGQGRPKRELTECVPPAAPAHSLGGRSGLTTFASFVTASPALERHHTPWHPPPSRRPQTWPPP